MARERRRRRARDLDLDELALPAVPSKLTVLLWGLRPRRREGSVRLGPSTRTSIVRPTNRCACSRARRWTNSTSRSIRSRFTGWGSWSGIVGGLGAAPGREDEREGAVVAHLVHDLERLGEVLLGLAGEADDDVGRQGAIRYVLADLARPDPGSARGCTCGASP